MDSSHSILKGQGFRIWGGKGSEDILIRSLRNTQGHMGIDLTAFFFFFDICIFVYFLILFF